MNAPVVSLPSGPATARKPRILLAEGEPSLSVFLCEILEPDYEVEVATDCTQAWQAARQRPPGLVLADALLREVDGIGLTRRLRADARTATLPIILLCNGTDSHRLLRALHPGVQGLFFKPFHVRELLELVHDQLPP